MIPRVDVEPLYSTVKEHVGDKWAEYKELLCRFMLGKSPRLTCTSQENGSGMLQGESKQAS